MSKQTHISRRFVALERNYSCGSCGHSQRSWSRERECSACGKPLTVAVIRRVAVAGAG